MYVPTMDVVRVGRGGCCVAAARIFLSKPRSATSPSLLHLTLPLHFPSLKASLSTSLRGFALPPLGSAQQIHEGKDVSDEEIVCQDEHDELEDWYHDQERKIHLSDGKAGNGKELRPSDSSTFQLLGNKEKKQLRACAQQLGKDLVVQTVGKWGISATVITSLSDALEANELIKVKVLDNCPDELAEIIQKLADSTKAQIVGKIGRTVLLYRPSLTKLTAAQKKSQNSSIKRRGRHTSKKDHQFLKLA